jgi:hypothetical protein
MYIINIRGVSGSGKTYIYERFKKCVPCFDTDDLIYEAYQELATTKKFKRELTKPCKKNYEHFPDPVMRMIKNKAKDILDKKLKHLLPGSPVIIVGITLKVESDLRFFITHTKDELESIYRRVVKREVNKIANNIEDIRQIISTTPADEIGILLLHKYGIDAMSPVTPYAGYIEGYRVAKAHEKKAGAICASQSKIIERLDKLCVNNFTS